MAQVTPDLVGKAYGALVSMNGEKYIFPACTTYGIQDGKIKTVQVHTGDQHGVDRYMWAQFKLKNIPARLSE